MNRRPPTDREAWAESRGDTRWLSYDDLADISGIKRASVTRMVRRKKWAKRSGNEPGSVRVEVPTDTIERLQSRKRARPPAVVPEPEPEAAAPPALDMQEIARAVNRLETALIAVRAERDQLQAELERAREAAKADRAMSEHERAAAAAERVQAAEDRNRLAAQVTVLTSELAQQHAVRLMAIREREGIERARQASEQLQAEERSRASDQRARLSAQVNVLSAELARLHAFPRTVVEERPAATATPLLTRVALLARRLRQGG